MLSYLLQQGYDVEGFYSKVENGEEIMDFELSIFRRSGLNVKLRPIRYYASKEEAINAIPEDAKRMWPNFPIPPVEILWYAIVRAEHGRDPDYTHWNDGTIDGIKYTVFEEPV